MTEYTATLELDHLELTALLTALLYLEDETGGLSVPERSAKDKLTDAMAPYWREQAARVSAPPKPPAVPTPPVNPHIEEDEYAPE